MNNELLDKLETALNDWLHTYAPEQFGKRDVKESRERIRKHGTLYYISTLLQDIREERATNLTNLGLRQFKCLKDAFFDKLTFEDKASLMNYVEYLLIRHSVGWTDKSDG